MFLFVPWIRHGIKIVVRHHGRKVKILRMQSIVVIFFWCDVWMITIYMFLRGSRRGSRKGSIWGSIWGGPRFVDTQKYRVLLELSLDTLVWARGTSISVNRYAVIQVSQSVWFCRKTRRSAIIFVRKSESDLPLGTTNKKLKWLNSILSPKSNY